MTADPVAILQDLIRCPSVTPLEGGALDYLARILGQAGFACHRLKFSDQDTPDVDNLFARWGTGSPHLCFAGHTDVVPPGDLSLWTHPPFAAKVANGHIYGRGAADMKGAVAAFAAAALDWIGAQGKAPGSISFLITGDEEGPAINGTLKVLQWMKANNHVPDHCIVGEPTCPERLGDTIKIGRRGSLSFAVTVDGKQAHAAYPHKGDNPIPKLARFVDRVAGMELDQGNAHFEQSTLAFTSFDVGNPATNVIPSRAVAKFNIRFNTEHTAASLKVLIQREIDAVRQQVGGKWGMKAHEGAEAFLTKPGSFVRLVQEAVKAETGITPALSTGGGTSDARFVKDYCPVLEFGPLSGTIHQTDERIGVDELKAVTNIYARILQAYFA